MAENRHLMAGVAIVAVGAAWLGVQPVALADPGNYDTPDGNPHGWCFGEHIDAWEYDQVFSKMNWIDSNTDMNQHFDSNCDWTPGAMTDMHIMDVDLPSDWRGSTFCTSLHGNGSCDRWDVQVDEDKIFNQSVQSGLPFRKNHGKTFCHEIGHSLGLDHYSKNVGYADSGGVQDCMVSGEVTAADAWQRYSPHHINAHINVEF